MWQDQTRIRILSKEIEGSTDGVFAVKEGGESSGLLLFSVTTDSKKPVEITGIDIDYAAPFQLLDPGNRGFFDSAGSLDSVLPFRMYWRGHVIVRPDLQQAFALMAKFPLQTFEQRIRITVYASGQRMLLGRFSARGRQQVTSREYRVRLISGPVLDIALPPGHSFTSPQPFLIKSALHASGGPGSVAVHEALSDGTTRSAIVDLSHDD